MTRRMWKLWKMLVSSFLSSTLIWMMHPSMPRWNATWHVWGEFMLLYWHFHLTLSPVSHLSAISFSNFLYFILPNHPCRHPDARVRKSAVSVFGEVVLAMVGATIPEDDDEDEDEEEGDSNVKNSRRCVSARMKKTKKRVSAWTCTPDPYIEKVRARQRRRAALKPIEETEAVRSAREFMIFILSPLYCHMVFQQPHEPSISLTALQSIVPVARAFGRHIMEVEFLSSLQRHAQTALSHAAQALLISSLPKLQVTLGPELSAYLFVSPHCITLHCIWLLLWLVSHIPITSLSIIYIFSTGLPLRRHPGRPEYPVACASHAPSCGHTP